MFSCRERGGTFFKKWIIFFLEIRTIFFGGYFKMKKKKILSDTSSILRLDRETPRLKSRRRNDTFNFIFRAWVYTEK